MDLPQEVVCINDRDRPEVIPTSKWIKVGQTYTVIRIVKMAIQGGYGVQLKEIDLSDCQPYQFFAAYRFAPLPDSTLKEAMEILETKEESR